MRFGASCRLLQAPASRIVGVLAAPGGQIARVLRAKADIRVKSGRQDIRHSQGRGSNKVETLLEEEVIMAI